MKVKVLKKFKDAHTGEINKKNKILDVDEKRYTEIIAVDETLVEIIEEKEEAEQQSEESKAEQAEEKSEAEQIDGKPKKTRRTKEKAEER